MKGNYLVMYILHWDALRSRHVFVCAVLPVFLRIVLCSPVLFFVLFEIFIILLYIFFSLEKEQRKNDIKFKRAIVIKHFSS